MIGLYFVCSVASDKVKKGERTARVIWRPRGDIEDAIAIDDELLALSDSGCYFCAVPDVFL